MIQWHIETRKLSKLKNHPKNPRSLNKQQEEQITQSLQRFGLADKPIINTDGTIIGGHQRKRILSKLGYKEIECWVPDRELTEKEVDELNVRLNRNTGEFDYDILANEFEIPDLVDWGFSIEDLLGEQAEEIAPEEDQEDDELKPCDDADAESKPGDIYTLYGEGVCHYIGCGDSTNPEFVTALMGDKEPTLMVTDPPYGVEYDAERRIGKGGKAGKGCRATGKVKNDDKVDWSVTWALFPGNVAYVWHAGRYCSQVEKSLTDNGFNIISQIIWAKQNFTLSRGDYHWKHEPCWYAVRDGHPHNWQGARDQSTVWEIASMSAMGANKDQDMRTGHSTQKPIECMARPIRNNTQKGEWVYDPFLGSGTTLIAAEQLGRNCIGGELSPAYVDIIINRWVNYMQKKGVEYKVLRNNEEIQWAHQKQK